MRKLSKIYNDDEYYTTEKTAKKFVDLVVIPSGILKHKTILMPFSNDECPLYLEMKKHHDNIKAFTGNLDEWKNITKYDDIAVIDNPPFSMSTKIEKFYFENSVPFILFRSGVSYPITIYRQNNAGIVYENSKDGVEFEWGLEKHIKNDEYITENYPNLIDNLKAFGALKKNIRVGFSFYGVDYDFKVKTVTFSRLQYPKKKYHVFYAARGVYDENTKMWVEKVGGDNRVCLLSR